MRSDHRIALGWCGPPQHGIPRLARQIADAAKDLGFAGTVVAEPDPARVATVLDRLPPGVRVLHLHVNDWLFADAAADADAAVTALVRNAHARGVAITMTLHDLPWPSDEPELYRRRARTYRMLVDAAAGTVVSSEHERELLRAATGVDAVTVIPLPIDPMVDHRPPAPADPAGRPTVAIFGYLYPGKGHRELLDDLAGGQYPVDVLAIGRPSDRHGELVHDLTRVAARQGMSFSCTGYVADADLAVRLRAAVIPVAPHTHISASGSINSWIAAGRRPLVPAGRYADELDRRMPGAVWIYQPGELPGAVARAVENPSLTWLPSDVVVGPTTASVAGTYLGWLRRISFADDGGG